MVGRVVIQGAVICDFPVVCPEHMGWETSSLNDVSSDSNLDRHHITAQNTAMQTQSSKLHNALYYDYGVGLSCGKYMYSQEEGRKGKYAPCTSITLNENLRTQTSIFSFWKVSILQDLPGGDMQLAALPYIVINIWAWNESLLTPAAFRSVYDHVNTWSWQMYALCISKDWVIFESDGPIINQEGDQTCVCPPSCLIWLKQTDLYHPASTLSTGWAVIVLCTHICISTFVSSINKCGFLRSRNLAHVCLSFSNRSTWRISTG